MHKLTYSNSELLEGILAKDTSVLTYVYRVYYPSIRQLIISNSGSEEDAQDVFQEVMIVFYRKLQEQKFILTSTLKTYLYSIARLIWLKQLKKAPNFVDLNDALKEEKSEDTGIIEAIERSERLELYHEKFEELSSDCKRVLKMFLNNIPIAEVTRAMGYKSDQHTKNRRFRCKISLIKKIKSSNIYLELGHENSKKNTDIPRW